MSDKTHWKRLVNPDYIGAYALPVDADLTVTIDFVKRETVKMAGGKKEECTVAHLVGQKPFILNATNSKSIHRLYGPYIEDWSGKKITLYASTTKFGTEIVECLRVRPSVEQPALQAIPQARFDKALASIKAGQYTAEKLRAGFVLTEEQEQQLTALESADVQV